MDRKLIFDVGLNIGQDTAFYLSQGHRVVAIEADPTLAEAGRQRFRRDVEAGNLEIVNVGIAAEEGEAQFWICEGKPEFNSFYEGIAARDGYPHHSITIPTQRFASILDRFGTPYYLKIDIEGHDMLCLADLRPSSLPKYLSIESECPVDGHPIGVEDGLRVLRRLHELGYRRFKLIDQRSFCSLSLPRSINYLLNGFATRWLVRPPLDSVPGSYRLSQYLMPRSILGRKFRHQFPLGSSGAWGEDTPGDWMRIGKAESAYRHYRESHFENPAAQHYTFWCDWHAKVD